MEKPAKSSQRGSIPSQAGNRFWIDAVPEPRNPFPRKELNPNKEFYMLTMLTTAVRAMIASANYKHFMRRALNEAEKVLLSGEFLCAQDPKHCFILDLFFESGQYLLEWKPFEKQHAFA